MKTSLYLVSITLCSSLALSACQTAPKLAIDNIVTAPMPILMVSLDSDSDGVIDELDQCPGTPYNVVIDERGCPFTMPGVGLKMEYRAFFAKGSSELTPKYQIELDKVAAKMKEYDMATMLIEGSISENEINDGDSIDKSNTLAKNRALIVKNYLLLKHGIEPSRLTTLNCEARAPIAPNNPEEDKTFNRRVYGLLTEPEEQKGNDYPSNLKAGICVEF